jgi:ABC-2 type transport system permease protein
MNAPSAAAPLHLAAPSRHGLIAAYRAEQRKLLAQGAIRVIALCCALLPLLFALLASSQSGLPADSLLGIWVHSSGAAVGFVVLDFAGYLGFPVLAGLVAGDLFASEDRFGTWKIILTRSRSRGELFAAKVLAGCALTCALALLAALSSVAGGLLFVGSGPLVDLGGTLLGGGEAVLLLLCGWVLDLPPLIGLVSLAVLLSVASRSGIVAVLGTVLVGLLMQLLAFVGNGSVASFALLGTAFDDWHGLLGDPRFFGPLGISLAVSAIWTAACLWAAWLLLRRREFAGPAVSRRQGWAGVARPVLAVALGAVAIGAAAKLAPSELTRSRLASSFGPSFERLTVLQQRELGRSVAPGQHLNMRTRCSRHGAALDGPGDDWGCTLTLAGNEAGWNPVNLTTVTYDLSVKSNGCYKADAPPSFVGAQTMAAEHGATVVNPLYTIYGCFDPLASSRCPEAAPCETFPRPRSAAPAAGGAAQPSAAERALQLRQLHEAERAAGPAVIREQEAAERRYSREGSAGGGSGR